ncbi:MAG: aldehyde ferredoxin oxidoreductase C-terminal domain-containing protein, partial [Atribacterota bacterium]|nr:aldehyde ferredoxin oxidoreductase C-terminal domain-containing protein [Atribacterota bacterium]
MMNIYKKDYEPYQALGPLCGIFDQRAAEKLVRHADSYGFDAITIGGILAWLMDCLEKDLLSPADLGLKDKPI